MNQQFYPYYNNNAENNAFGYNPPRRKTSTGRHPSSQTESTHRFRSTSAQQILPNKKLYVHKQKGPTALPSTKLLRPHSKSNVETFSADKPRLTDISSQESDQRYSSKSNEFKKWSQQQKINALRKAKSQHSGGVDEGYMRHASSSYPYAPQQRQYYGNINNYIDTQYRSRNQHTRDQSQQSLHSLQSLQSESINTQLSNNGVSSSSDDFIKENVKHYGSYYTDYASPSPTQIAKMWPGGGASPGYQLNNQLSNTSQASTSTKHSIGSMKTMNFVNRNSSYSSIFSEVSKHLEQCIQFLQQQIPRDYIQFMNKAMVKITLEFCSFDIENVKKFNPLFVQLQQHLKIQHVHTTQNASTMSYFVYSGDKLLEYLNKCVDLLSSYIQSPRAIGHANELLLNVLYSYYVKRHGAYSMSAYALSSFYEICYEYRLAQEQMKKMNDKLAVVKNLFHDEIKTPSPRAILTTESDTASTSKVLMGNINAPQHNLTQQISAPVKHHQLQPNPINHSKSHPEMSVKHAKHKNDNKGNDDASDGGEYKGDDGRESTPVLSDVNDIDHHLSSSNNMQTNTTLSMEYDSDIQSEMSATPQPSDIQRAIIQQFIPGAMNQNMANIKVMHEMKDENIPNNIAAPKMIQSERSNDADDEVSSPGSMSTSTDNDTIGTDSRFKTIKTLTPTPHTQQKQKIARTGRSSQILPSPVEELRTSKSKKHSTTPIPTPSKNNNKMGFGKRQSWTEVTTAKIDVYVSNDKTEFKSFSPINPKQGVENMIKEFRKSLGQNELKGAVEELRKEMASASASCSDDDDNVDIVHVNEQSDCSDCSGEADEDVVDEDDEFFDDDELEAKQAKYISLTSSISNVTSNKNKLDLNRMNSNDTTSSRYQKPKANYNMIPQQNTAQKQSSHSRTSRSNKNKNKTHKRPSREDIHRYASHDNNNKSSANSNQSSNILYDNGILSNNKHRNRRGSDSETGALRNLNYQYSNNTVQSKHRQRHNNNNNGTQPQPLDLKYYNSNSSRHSRSSSDFISNNANLYKSRPLLKKKSSSTQEYNNYQQLSLYEEESLSPRSANSARIYQQKQTSPIQQRVPAKYDQIRKNYIVRAKYVDQHKSFSKYSSDRNKSWKKWIKLLQSHHSDITNVASPAQVQTLIDFARMSLGNYGNWLMMKSGSNTGSQSSLSSTKSSQSKWSTYFAVMRDFNLFLFRQECVPSNLDDVVNEDYLALSVAHIENVKTCSKNPAELYLEVTGSKSNHKLKFRCESTDACQQWVAEMNYQIHIVSDLCCNQSLRLECADQKRSIWIPVAPLTQINPYSSSN